MIAIVEYIHITEKIGNVYLIKRVHNMNEIVKNWLIELYEREIKEALGSISNERIWLMGTDVLEEEKMHLDNMANLNEYITTLKTLLNDIREVK